MTFDVGKPPMPGRGRLTIGSLVQRDHGPTPSLARGSIRGIRLRGARLGEVSEDQLARARPALLLAEHEPRAALEALALVESEHPRAEQLRLLALDELGDVVGVDQAAPALLARLDDPTWRGDLALVLRLHPLAGAALRHAAGSAILPTLAAVWAYALPLRNDVHMRSEFLVGLAGIESLVPTTPAERAALARLLNDRAELWKRCGELERARADLERARAFDE
jgi:hypothetical protein